MTADHPAAIERKRRYRAALRANRTLTLDYVYKIPSRVPAGRVLVHNVLPTRVGARGFLPLGSRGFRAWLARPSDHRLYVCGCGWAPKLGEHYRVKRCIASVPGLAGSLDQIVTTTGGRR